VPKHIAKFEPKEATMKLFMLSILPVAFLACDPAAAENVTIHQVVLSTDIVPGGVAPFDDLGAPSINAQGAIAFGASVGSAIYTTARGRAVGQLIRAVGAGDVPPGVLGSFGGVDEPSLNDDGSFAFRGFGPDSSDRGIYLFLARGKLKLVADASTLRPGTQETFSSGGPSVPLASDGGHIVFSDSTASTQGVYRADFDTTTRRPITLAELVILEDGFVGLPGFESPLGYAINDSGVVAMVLLRLDFTRGIYVARPNGSLRPIVAEGDRTPGGGNFTGNLGAPSIDALGRIAFFGGFNDNLGVGIFIANPGGVITKTKVVDNNTKVPNHPGTFFSGFGSIHLADDGTIIFQGGYRLNGLDFQGLYKKSSVGLEVIFDQFDGLVVKGKHISLVSVGRGGGGLPMFLAARFADVVDDTLRVAFLQELPPEEVGSATRTGIFVAVQR
jgi:hypothetical protein